MPNNRLPIGVGHNFWHRRKGGEQEVSVRRHQPPQFLEPVDLPHPAHADLGGHFVGAEADVKGEGQTCVDYTAGAVARTGLRPRQSLGPAVPAHRELALHVLTALRAGP